MTHDEAVKVAVARALARSGRGRAIRIASGLSLREVAAAIGAASTSVQRWEMGQTLPRGENALRYGALLADLERIPVPAS